MLKPCLLLMSLMLPEQGSATEQEHTVTSSLRASPFPKKPGTAQISPGLGASFDPHGMLCSGISKEKQKEKAAKCSRDLEAQTGLVLSCQEDGSSMEHTHPHPLLTNPALPTPGQPSRSAGGTPLPWKHLPDFSRHLISLMRLFPSPTRLLRLLERISQDLDASQPRQQSLTTSKTSPKEVWVWPNRNRPIYNPISAFITSLADGQIGQCCQSSGSQITIIPSGFGRFDDTLLLLRSENHLQITPSQFQKCLWLSRKPAP